MIALLLAFAAFWLNNSKYLSSGIFAGPLPLTALLQICHRRLLIIAALLPTTAEKQTVLHNSRTPYTFGWLNWQPGKMFGLKLCGVAESADF